MALRILPPLVLAFVLAAAPSSAQQSPAPSSAQQTYVPGVEDLPLMPGLQALPGVETKFDSPGGRIVIAYAEGATNRGRVVDYYASALPQLGWERAGDAAFRREGEQLRLEFGERGSSLTVRFTLSPIR